MRSLHKIGTAKVHKKYVLDKFNRPLGDEVGLDEGVDGSGDEQEDDEGSHNHADDLEPLEPGLAAPADGLEHTPEAVHEVEPDGCEPDKVEDEDPPLAERSVEQEVGIVLEIAYSEHLGELHLGPEVGQVEADESEDDDTEDKHILGGPGVGLGLARDLISLPTSTGLDILPGKPASVDDVHEETKCEDRHHNVNEGSAHKVAAELEEAVSGREELVVIGDHAVLAGEGVDDGEEVDGTVQQKEDDKESTTDALDEFLSDGGVEYEHFYWI